MLAFSAKSTFPMGEGFWKPRGSGYPCSLFPVPCSLLPVPYSLIANHYSLFPAFLNTRTASL